MNTPAYYRRRRKRFSSFLALVIAIGIGLFAYAADTAVLDLSTKNLPEVSNSPASLALSELPIKGRAPKTGYDRELFSDGWANTLTCDVRNEILQRDLENETLGPDGCIVLTGTLHDPYSGKVIQFTRGAATSSLVQIDHVVAVSDAWQKGAQQLTAKQRFELYNDPLNLLATDGETNQIKGNSDVATWLPPNKAYRCDYVARQIAVKQTYGLWITQSEFEAMNSVLNSCPTQLIPN